MSEFNNAPEPVSHQDDDLDLESASHDEESSGAQEFAGHEEAEYSEPEVSPATEPSAEEMLASAEEALPPAEEPLPPVRHAATGAWPALGSGRRSPSCSRLGRSLSR